MTRSLLTLTTALGLTLFAMLPLSAQENQPQVADQTADQTAAADAAPAPVQPTDSGAFLAARNAETAGDFRAAAAWFSQALTEDPDNALLMDGTIFAQLSLGNIDGAAVVAAHRKALATPDEETQLADLALISQDAIKGDFTAVTTALDAGQSVGPLVDGLARAWADFGEGNMTEAVTEFDKIAATRGLEAHGLYHKALAFALAGDFEGADKALSTQGLGLNRRGVLAHVQILSQLERNQDAIALIDRTWANGSEPVADALRARLEAGETIPFDTIKDAREGMAEVFWSLATLLNGEADPAFVQLNCRIAVALKPDHDDAILLGAAMLEEQGQYDLAEETYSGFAPDHPSWYNAQLGRAAALYAAGRADAAIEALQDLTKSHGDMLVVQAALGDTLRREERWAEAETAYDAAIALLPANPPRGSWVLYFSRAITKERQQRYDESDLDFRKSLEINPGQPEVLNYLGYSLLERRQNLDEALQLIEEAVAAAPDAGYILDSLAWAYFTLGRYEEALAPMERASLLEPVEPVITDHLGDVYWMNGRKREAEFQWHRALSYGPEEKDATRIRRKLEIGLDATLAEEGTTPAAAIPAPPQAPAAPTDPRPEILPEILPEAAPEVAPDAPTEPAAPAEQSPDDTDDDPAAD
ncbi:tetratricopeptide repeat protein [Xinfangfangia sp. D13-10-4-6]|uniref:tetratricopeptide repeat protein n=1 Tax=Pseudogemmobacter hezensis TaxID=2737662 RepID=UPI00155598EA|nr:tetratricopeptide repeat protein [Pseudogemmobacter hezensis]NPD17245.1 tetratricopeptide repeat protein [Pseudogemmobacter hezensis]